MNIDYGTTNGFAACLRAITKLSKGEVPKFDVMEKCLDWYQPLLKTLHHNGYVFAGTFLITSPPPAKDDWELLEGHSPGIDGYFIGKTAVGYRVFKHGKCVDGDSEATELFMIQRGGDHVPASKHRHKPVVESSDDPVSLSVKNDIVEPTDSFDDSVAVGSYPFSVATALACEELVEAPVASRDIAYIGDDWLKVYLSSQP